MRTRGGQLVSLFLSQRRVSEVNIAGLQVRQRTMGAECC